MLGEKCPLDFGTKFCDEIGELPINCVGGEGGEDGQELASKKGEVDTNKV